MNAAEFERSLDTHGADLERWPEAERSAALAHLATSPESRRRWSGARRLEELVARDRALAEQRDRYQEREAAITAAALRRVRALPRRPAPGWRWFLSRPLAATLAATALAGAVLGLLTGREPSAPRSEPVSAIEVLLTDTTYDLEGSP